MKHELAKGTLRALLSLALGTALFSSTSSAQVLLAEDFESLIPTNLPPGWQAGPTSPTMWYSGDSSIGGCGNAQTPTSAVQMLCNNGNAPFFANPCTTSLGTYVLRTPPMTPVHLGPVTISFEHHIALGPGDRAEVRIASSAAGSPTPLVVGSDTLNLPPGGLNVWNKSEVIVPYALIQPFLTASGNNTFEVDFNLVVNSGGTSGFGIDNVSIASTYPLPVVFCDGSVASSCPCGNLGGPGEGCANSAGGFTMGAVLGATGIPSVSNSTLVLTASGMPANKPCHFFQGTGPVFNPVGYWGDGRLCLVPSLNRLELVQSDAMGSCSTSIDLPTAGAIMIGQSAYYQAQYRDPAGPCGLGFNSTNGLQIDWLLQ